MKISVQVRGDELTFNVDHSDYNQYINAQMPNDKVAPTFNFLSNTVDAESKEAFREMVLDDGQPNGILLMSIAGAITEEIGGDLQVTVKKPKTTQKESKVTLTNT
jgi:hypothetical protein